MASLAFPWAAARHWLWPEPASTPSFWRPTATSRLATRRFAAGCALAAIRPARRQAVLVATVLEVAASRTDDAVLMFDRIVACLFRRAERRVEATLKRDRGTINAKVRLLARLGDALLTARRDEHLAHLSPLGGQHINLNGDYLCSEGAGNGRLRPLRPSALTRNRTEP